MGRALIAMARGVAAPGLLVENYHSRILRVFPDAPPGLRNEICHMPAVQDNIAHLLTAVRDYLDAELDAFVGGDPSDVLLGNIGQLRNGSAQGVGVGDTQATTDMTDRIVLTLIRTAEDPVRKNRRNYRPDPRPGGTGIEYRNPPVGLDLTVLVTATHGNYVQALELLSAVVAVFQRLNRLEEGDVAWPSGNYDSQSLKFSLLSPTLEEINHMWSMLGGQQLPSLLYLVQTAEVEYIPDSPTPGPPVREIILNETID